MAREQSLQEEIKKRQPFELPEEEAFLNLLRTTAQLSAEFEPLFKASGLSEAQYNVLRILRGAGGDGLPTGEIASRMVTRVPDITRLVDRLEAAGHVGRCRTGGDRRVVLVKITPKALDVLRGLDQPLREVHRLQLGHLPATELDQLNRLLVKARHRPTAEPT